MIWLSMPMGPPPPIIPPKPDIVHLLVERLLGWTTNPPCTEAWGPWPCISQREHPALIGRCYRRPIPPLSGPVKDQDLRVGPLVGGLNPQAAPPSLHARSALP